MKKAILIVSFGTTYPGTRQKNITAIREQVQALYPDVLIEEAVSSTIVRKAMRTREDIEAKSPAEGLEALKEKGATNVVVLPTHIIDGIENHRMKQVVQEYAQDFASIAVAATGMNITRLRINAGLSVKDLADIFGFATPQAVYKWQHGVAMPTLDNLVVLAAVFGVSMDEIIA